jgi:threonine/homoserine/homoserine lactone efflux protein
MTVAVTSFAVFAASQISTPGPANMAMLTTGAAHGLRAALPFMLGVLFGKQLIIWPIGFGLMGLAQQVPLLYAALKYASAAYVIYLAWRVAQLRLRPGQGGTVPGFWAGLIVHPLNPKAWAMITAGFTGFVTPGTPALQATAIISVVLFLTQCVFHPLWTFGGDRIAATVSGTHSERVLMLTLAALTVASVLFVLISGGGD